MAANIQVRERARLNSLNIRTHDCIDGAIKILSNFDKSYYLNKRMRDTFSFHNDGMLVIKNVSEEAVSVDFSVEACTGDMLIARSNRRGAFLLRQGMDFKTVLKAGEALTLRSNTASDPHGYTNL